MEVLPAEASVSHTPAEWLRMGRVSDAATLTAPLLAPGVGSSPGLCLLTTSLLLVFDGKFLWPLLPLRPGAASWNPDVAGLGARAGSPG